MCFSAVINLLHLYLLEQFSSVVRVVFPMTDWVRVRVRVRFRVRVRVRVPVSDHFDASCDHL